MPFRQRVSQAVIILILTGALRIILGLASQVIIAHKFGATTLVDAYLVSFSVPRIFGDYLVGSALFFAFIPVLIEYRLKKGEEEIWRIIWTIVNVITAGLIGMSLLYVISAPWLMRLLAPGFIPETHQMAVIIARIISPLFLFLSLSLVTNAIYQSYRHFLIPGLAALVFPCIVIASVLIFADKLSVYSLALGVVTGALVQFVIQWGFLPKVRHAFKLSFDLHHPVVKKIVKLALPILIAVIIGQIVPIFGNILASKLGGGKIAALGYATYVISACTLFILFLPTVTFPLMSEQASGGKLDRFKETFAFSLRLTNFISLPVMVILILFRIPIIRILFEHGNFGLNDTNLVANVLLCLAPGVLAFVGRSVLARSFYATQDSLTPLKVTLVTTCSYIPLSLILTYILGIYGLALSFSLTAILGMFILVVYFRRKITHIGGQIILASLAKAIFASVIMGMAAWFVSSKILVPPFGHPFIALVSSVLLSFAVFIAVVLILRMNELKWLLMIIRLRKISEIE